MQFANLHAGDNPMATPRSSTAIGGHSQVIELPPSVPLFLQRRFAHRTTVAAAALVGSRIGPYLMHEAKMGATSPC